jgi:predicted lipid-binding transport protein (Tim44 family)
MSDPLDLLDFIWSPAAWRKMSGPLAFTTALLGGLLGLLFAVAGGLACTGSETLSFRLFALGAALIGLWLLGSVIVGVIAFLRANREPS